MKAGYRYFCKTHKKKYKTFMWALHHKHSTKEKCNFYFFRSSKAFDVVYCNKKTAHLKWGEKVIPNGENKPRIKKNIE